MTFVLRRQYITNTPQESSQMEAETSKCPSSSHQGLQLFLVLSQKLSAVDLPLMSFFWKCTFLSSYPHHFAPLFILLHYAFMRVWLKSFEMLRLRSLMTQSQRKNCHTHTHTGWVIYQIFLGLLCCHTADVQRTWQRLLWGSVHVT